MQAEVVLKDVNGKRRVGLCHIAAMNGHTKMIGRLKEMGLPLDACDSWGETPLMWAVQKVGDFNWMFHYLRGQNFNETRGVVYGIMLK